MHIADAFGVDDIELNEKQDPDVDPRNATAPQGSGHGPKASMEFYDAEGPLKGTAPRHAGSSEPTDR